LTVRHAIPAIYEFREFAAAGGLMSYGSSEPEYFRLVGTYAGRVLKGDKPADLPVQQSTKVELFLNFKTAKALGITVPLPLSGRPDEFCEGCGARGRFKLNLPRRNFLHLAAGAAALPVVPRIACAQAYPSRPVRLIEGFGAGSALDIVARLIGQSLSEQLG